MFIVIRLFDCATPALSKSELVITAALLYVINIDIVVFVGVLENDYEKGDYRTWYFQHFQLHDS